MSESSSLKIKSSTGPYEVFVEEGVFEETLSRMDDSFLLADEFFRSRLPALSPPPIFIEANEQTKSLDQMPRFIEQLRLNGATRGAHLVVLGGGVVQDVATFIASVYMRGIGWSYSPTTVLAMVDSCIGGKSSINVGPYKNLIGTFHTPSPVLVDPANALTLPPDQFASGLIEAAKITFCRSPEAFAAHLATGPSTSMSTASLEALILNSLRSKKYFIEIDEFDKKERLLLNFGHTFGHALEGASHYAIPHGTAVGLGILCSLALQRGRGIYPQVSELETHLDGLIRTLPGLAEHLRALSLDEILDRFASDKKHTTNAYTLILIDTGGQVVLEQIPRIPAFERSLRNAIQTVIERYQS